jgi:hypothetical protein
MDALRSLMRTPNLQSEVAEFVAHELDRADRIEGARSMLDYVTIGSWVLQVGSMWRSQVHET